MRRSIATAAVIAAVLVFTLAACGGASLSGTTWKGAVALTEVTVNFESGGQYTSPEFGNGTYSVNDNQVSLVPSGQGETRVLDLNGSIMQGAVDGWSCTLNKQ